MLNETSYNIFLFLISTLYFLLWIKLGLAIIGIKGYFT